MTLSLNCSQDVVLAGLIDEYTAQRRSGKVNDPESFIEKHPDHADALRRLLPAMEILDALGQSVAGLSGRAPDPGSRDHLWGVLGDFRILREVGRGGMGVVYEAEQISLGRRVALKVLPFAATMDHRHLQRFQNEARAAACLHHTNIVPVHGLGSDRGVHYYAMQFIEGQTLAALIAAQRQGPQ